ncbi:MAG: hypothetical protein R2857_14090 [Vampirovibrionales bacterium]
MKLIKDFSDSTELTAEEKPLQRSHCRGYPWCPARLQNPRCQQRRLAHLCLVNRW